MKAQDLYDLRDETGLISGTDLHEVFQAVCGEPSPAGMRDISPGKLEAYASDLRAAHAAHKANGGRGGNYLLDIAMFCESATRNA